MRDYRLAELAPADRALCDFAVKLTLTPGLMTQHDVAWLRGFGFDDDAITIAVQVIGYFNYINRVADGLGVDPEPDMPPDADTWLASKAMSGAYLATLPPELHVALTVASNNAISD